MDKKIRHYEDSVVLKTTADSVFAYADNFNNFSSHMNKSSWMIGGGMMETKTDEEKGQKVGSHIKMRGKVFGITLFLDEVVTQYEPPLRKAWQTVGDLSLLVIGNYELGFEINPENNNSKFKVYINYELPRSLRTRWLGFLFGGIYAKWCVKQMISGTKEHFKN